MNEIIAFILIFSIIIVIAIPRIGGFIEQSEIDVCEANQNEVTRFYHDHLKLENVAHSESLFTQFLVQYYSEPLCAQSGLFTYGDGEVECSEHGKGDDAGSGGEVPWL